MDTTAAGRTGRGSTTSPSMGQGMAHGAKGSRIFPERGRLTREVAAGLKAAVSADPRSVAMIAAEAGIGERFVYSLMAGDRRPSRDVAYRLIDVLSLPESLAGRIVEEASPGVARSPMSSTWTTGR